MILDLKVFNVPLEEDLENDLALEEDVAKFVIRDSAITGIWVDPDLEEMYVYIADSKVTVAYEPALHMKICKILGHGDFRLNTMGNGIS